MEYIKKIQFINEYQRQECLWDPKHLQYKNKIIFTHSIIVFITLRIFSC
ncbi:hypothetical protein FEC38_19100 [Acinetobacter baumannii]|nr:hypothetical protein FEC38_19100 [Acinetobacter baumannii]